MPESQPNSELTSEQKAMIAAGDALRHARQFIEILIGHVVGPFGADRMPQDARVQQVMREITAAEDQVRRALFDEWGAKLAGKTFPPATPAARPEAPAPDASGSTIHRATEAPAESRPARRRAPGRGRNRPPGSSDR